MKLTSPRLLALAAAALALNACSSEPSDWRPEQKVSLDQVAPGTRETQYFDQHTEHAPNQAKGAAITTPISSAMEVQGDKGPGTHTAAEATSANTEAGQMNHGKNDNLGKSTQEVMSNNGKPGQQTAGEGESHEGQH
ncbi:hypothetical protein GCM10023185_10890 [Hymenobacter saemangeumensis]|uniref:Lipoprotein n=1 Tax=Hymenobacter saemangeumensis TaxID=1084522 RepID=A0ABP8I5I0_9BACT